MQRFFGRGRAGAFSASMYPRYVSFRLASIFLVNGNASWYADAIETRGYEGSRLACGNSLIGETGGGDVIVVSSASTNSGAPVRNWPASSSNSATIWPLMRMVLSGSIAFPSRSQSKRLAGSHCAFDEQLYPVQPFGRKRTNVNVDLDSDVSDGAFHHCAMISNRSYPSNRRRRHASSYAASKSTGTNRSPVKRNGSVGSGAPSASGRIQRSISCSSARCAGR